MNIVHICILQLLDQAGRNGNQSCRVIYANKTDLYKCYVLQLKKFCTCTECHRKMLVKMRFVYLNYVKILCINYSM